MIVSVKRIRNVKRERIGSCPFSGLFRVAGPVAPTLIGTNRTSQVHDPDFRSVWQACLWGALVSRLRAQFRASSWCLHPSGIARHRQVVELVVASRGSRRVTRMGMVEVQRRRQRRGGR